MRTAAGLLTIVALAVSAAPAAAEPPGKGLITEGPYSCDGVETTITHSAGLSAYIGDQHYVVASFSFTPTGEPVDRRTFGHRTGLSGAVTCTLEEPDGVFAVVLLPVAP
jgi:hypothetical protein